MARVTLRHAASGRWCIEAPHPNYPAMPQPYAIGPQMSFGTLSAAVAYLERQGCVVVRNTKTKERVVYRGGRPIEAE